VPFPAFSRSLEGCTDHPYLDVLGWVTVAIGCKIDPLSDATPLAWQVDVRPATYSEVVADWLAVKNAPPDGLTPEDRDAWLHEHGAGYYAPRTRIRLTPAAVDALLVARLASFDAEMAARLPGWADAPASAQLATLSMCWAEGAGGVERSPRFDAAFAAGDWPTCAVECHLDDAGNPGLVPRNARNRALFLACATTDPDYVAWSDASITSPS
jgi:GH24 family phage-related lysozyme (muramidase)